MKRIGNWFPIFFALFIIGITAKGQKNEIGFSIGGFNYTGELSPGYSVMNYRPGGSLFYRLNLSPVVALRASVHGGYVHANEQNSSKAIPAVRAASFTTLITEAAVMAEYNFFNFRGRKDDRRLCPYLTAGIGIFNSKKSKAFKTSTNEYIVLCIPVGVGLKYKLTRQWNLGFECVARKTYTDQLDGISSYAIGTHETANIFDKDWYYYTGFTVSYTFYSVICKSNAWSQ
jgi:hypothetical protein